MADTNKKASVNPNLKENLCCALFFLLLPLFALINSYTVYGCVIFGVAAAFMIVRYAVMDPADEQLVIGHFGAYFAVSMIAVLGINFVSMLPTTFIFNIDASTAYDEHSLGGLVFAGIALVLKLFVFKKYNSDKFNQFIRMILDHLLTGCLFYGLIITFQEEYFAENNIILQIMAFFALLFILFDSYELYRTGSRRHHKRNIGAAVALYVFMLAGMLISKDFNTVTLLHDKFFALLQWQMVEKFIVFAVPMLVALVSYIVCFKGPFASQEVRIFAIYLLFMLPMRLMTLEHEVKYGWMLGFIHTAILAFALFYKGKAGGKLEQVFAAHKEYRVAISGIILLICMNLMKDEAYLTMVMLLAFTVVMVFLLTRSKPVSGKVIWQAAIAGFGLLSAALIFSASLPIKYVFAAVLIWFMSASALYLFTRGKINKADGWIMSVIGVSSLILQLVLSTSVI